MTPITITEALADLKTIQKRVAAKQAAILQSLCRQDAVKDPLLKQGGSEKYVAEQRQAMTDLLVRHLAIRVAIQAKNLATQLTIGTQQRSIAEWLTWRKEIAPTINNFYTNIRRQIDQ